MTSVASFVLRTNGNAPCADHQRVPHVLYIPLPSHPHLTVTLNLSTKTIHHFFPSSVIKTTTIFDCVRECECVRWFVFILSEWGSGRLKSCYF